MGEQDIHVTQDTAAMRRFTRQIINDIRAIEHMLRLDMFEADIRRIGAEQELFLINSRWHPAPVADKILEINKDPRLVSELTRFNLEFNLDPVVFRGDCLSRLHHHIDESLTHVRNLARQVDADIAMVGILPTIHASDLRIENMAPMERYYALNDMIMAMMGGTAQYRMGGVDELFFQHDNIMVEGCNTSFQTHYQVTPDEFAHYYNVAQLIAAPVLAAATNSPTLFGKRLWRETRIALFQQAVDTRSSNLYLRDMSPRVHFGSEWVNASVMELYKEDIVRFRVLMTSDFDDPFDVLKQGGVPKLRALQLHNGTVYRWNRACYGITDGKPHLRIENRVLPSGPTVIDEVANSAFWFGLESGLASRYSDIRPLLQFDEAKSNFTAAARLGLSAEISWIDGKVWPVAELIRSVLLPIAREGLESNDINSADIDTYLNVINERVASRMTGSQWQLMSLSKMKETGSTRAQRLDMLVSEMVRFQNEGTPGHKWPVVESVAEELTRIPGSRVEHYMSTDLFTVHEDELIEFVAVLMDWQKIRHVLIENRAHRAVLRYLAASKASGSTVDEPVSSIMVRDPVSISPDTSTRRAIQLMRDQKIGALPIVRDGQLVGIVTDTDFSRMASILFDESLGPH
jgi:CBS domain-containing protein